MTDITDGEKQTMKSAVEAGFDRIPIITYHSIDNSGSIVSTSPDVFRRQIGTLSAAGYRTLTLGELVELRRSGEWPSQKTAILTFDDGFENFLSEAAPILDEYSFSATVLLVTDRCGSFNDWAGNPANLPRSRLLSWCQIRELSGRGIEFGSHTATHPDLTMLSADILKDELSRSKNAIEDAIGKKVTSFAYPFGRFNRSVKNVVEYTYRSACSTDLGRIDPQTDMHALQRIDAYYLSNPRSFELLQSRWMDGYFSVRQMLRNLRQAAAHNGSRLFAGASTNYL